MPRKRPANSCSPPATRTNWKSPPPNSTSAPRSKEGHFTIHRSLLDELPVILRVYVECAARLYGNPREADLIKIHLHSRKLTFHYYRDFDKSAAPRAAHPHQDRPQAPLRHRHRPHHRPEHQLLFFKERFLAKDHPERPKMDRFSAKLRKLGLREETIGYGPVSRPFAVVAIEGKVGRNGRDIPK
jgi:DNA phosphorothioation-associated putative methyltransferase